MNKATSSSRRGPTLVLSTQEIVNEINNSESQDQEDNSDRQSDTNRNCSSPDMFAEYYNEEGDENMNRNCSSPDLLAEDSNEEADDEEITSDFTETEEEEVLEDLLLPDNTEEEVIYLGNPYIPAPSSSEQKHAGRKPKLVWEHYITSKENGKIFSNKCRHCKQEVSKQPCRMEKHLSQCKKYKKSLEKNEGSVKADDTEVPVSANAVPVASQRGLKFQSKISPFVNKITSSEKSKIDDRVSELIYCNNLPFTLVDSKEFKDLMNAASKGCYVPPSSKTIGEEMLDKCYKNTKLEIEGAIKNNPVTIAQDGWTSNQNAPVIAHCLVSNGKPYFLNAVNTGSEKKTSEYCAQLLEEAIIQAEKEFQVEVIGVVTDNCSTMTSMHEILKTKHPSLIAYGCNSHLLNLLGEKFTPKELISKVVKVQKYIRQHTFTAAKLKLLNGLRPILPGSTRWNSQIDCCKNFINNHGKYLDVMRGSMKIPKSRLDTTKEQEIYLILRDNDIYDQVADLIKVLEPISISLDKLQKDSSDVADAINCWILVRQRIPEEHSKSPYFQKQLKLAFHPQAIAAYMLHPKYRGKDLSTTERESGRKWLAEKNPMFLMVAVKLSNSCPEYFSPTMLEQSVVDTLTPIEWWRECRNANIPEGLVKLAETLYNLPASSAAMERSFSVLGNILTKKRNRLGLEKAEKLCCIYQNRKISKQTS